MYSTTRPVVVVVGAAIPLASQVAAPDKEAVVTAPSAGPSGPAPSTVTSRPRSSTAGERPDPFPAVVAVSANLGPDRWLLGEPDPAAGPRSAGDAT